MIAGYTFLVTDGELHVFEAGHDGDSEPISWDTARRLMFILQAVIEMARKNRDQ